MSPIRPRLPRAVRRLVAGFAAISALVVLAAAPAGAQQAVGLGTAESFAVLAGSGITNTGPTTITGDVGTFPTTTQTGFGSITLTGTSTNHGGDALTQSAKTDLVTAYNDAAGRLPQTSVATELGGTTLTSGVYTSPTFGLTGTLTLDGLNDPNASFVFQAGSTLITATDSRVLLINGANPCRVTWQVGSSATFGTRTSFVGDVLAQTSITANNSATFQGRLLARDGAVTLDTNTISNAACSVTNTSAVGQPIISGAAAPDLSFLNAPGFWRFLQPPTTPTTPGTPGAGPPRLALTGSPVAERVAVATALVLLGAAALVTQRRRVSDATG
jgi:hypothetical protein